MASDWTGIDSICGRYGKVNVVVDGGDVLLQTSGGVHVVLDTEARDHFAKAWAEAERQAEATSAAGARKKDR